MLLGLLFCWSWFVATGFAAVGVVFSSVALATILPMDLTLATTALTLALFFITPALAPTPTAPDNDRGMAAGFATGCLGGFMLVGTGDILLRLLLLLLSIGGGGVC